MNSLTGSRLSFAFTDLTKPWLNFQLPLRNVEAMREAIQKNATAFTNVNEALFDGLRILAQHQTQFFQSRIDDCRKVTADVLTSRSIEEGATKQADIVGRAYLSSVDHVRELSDIAAGANGSAIDILNTRVAEGFEELKAVLAAPVAASRAAPTEVIGEQTAATSAQGGPVGDVKIEPAATVNAPRRNKAKPAAKATRRRTSRK